MRARLGLRIGSVVIVGLGTIGCSRDNPAFDEPTAMEDTTGDAGSDEGLADTGDDSASLCELGGGMEMTIRVPQPCGETNDTLDIYEHWFKVVAATDSIWSVQFCSPDCATCEPVPGDLELSPLPVGDLAGPGTCMLMRARRLGTGDDCNYHTVSLQDMSAGGGTLVLARRTELLDLPTLDTGTGLVGFEPVLVVDETCDCAETPGSCCGDQAPTLYAYDVNGTQVRVGEVAPATIGQRAYDFWAFDAFESGECDAPISLSWALTAAN